MVGGVDYFGDFGDGFEDCLGDSLAQGGSTHGATLTAPSHGHKRPIVLNTDEFGVATV